MAEYIEREAAKKGFNIHFGDVHDAVIANRLIDSIPAADVAPITHGYWINTPTYRASNGNYNKSQECSVCHSLFVSPGYTPYSNHPYCCECGARMDEAK